MKNKTVCFSGHRKIYKAEQPQILTKLKIEIRKLVANGYCYFGTGGALGFDTLAAQAVLELKSDHPQIKLILVLPCPSQATRWPEKDVITYENIKNLADKITYTSDSYYSDCMLKRNRHLVNHSSVCVCYLTKASGGTFYTVNYAQEKGLKIINIATDPCFD